MGHKTPLYQHHVSAGAKMVDFGGWDMPLHYGSQIDEHHLVRRDAGMFDVSHMCIVDLVGNRVREFLRRLMANNVDKLKTPGKALYTCMLNQDAGVIDDMIVYYMNDDWFRVVVNAGTTEKDLRWIRDKAQDFLPMEINQRTDLSMLAVQGPNARQKASKALSDLCGEDANPEWQQKVLELDSFVGSDFDSFFVARTGYTGEDGFEIAIKEGRVGDLWDALIKADVAPCGLGARDTLRLEAGMNLYGSDMDETITPLECGLAWTVAWQPQEREFIGRPTLETQREAGPGRKLVGLVLLERGVLRGHQRVICEPHGEGEITSGSFSPTLSKSIAFARVPSAVNIGDECKVEIREKQLQAKIVKFPFVRNGQSCLKPEIQ